MKFGLLPSDIEKVNSVFATNRGIEKVVIYGSRAIGRFRPGSDIDLTIFAPGLSLSDLFEIQTQLDELLLPYKIDLSLFHQIQDDQVRDHIHRVGKVFYSR